MTANVLTWLTPVAGQQVLLLHVFYDLLAVCNGQTGGRRWIERLGLRGVDHLFVFYIIEIALQEILRIGCVVAGFVNIIEAPVIVTPPPSVVRSVRGVRHAARHILFLFRFIQHHDGHYLVYIALAYLPYRTLLVHITERLWPILLVGRYGVVALCAKRQHHFVFHTVA